MGSEHMLGTIAAASSPCLPYKEDRRERRLQSPRALAQSHAARKSKRQDAKPGLRPPNPPKPPGLLGPKRSQRGRCPWC